MDAFLTRKKRRVLTESQKSQLPTESTAYEHDQCFDQSIAILTSIFEDRSDESLLQALIDSDGSVEQATNLLLSTDVPTPAPFSRQPSSIKIQSSLTHLKSPRKTRESDGRPSTQPLTKKGRTLTLYSPEEISAHTPCSIIHNFLPADLANDLLREILPETENFVSLPLRVFDNIVRSPHTACFYVDTAQNPQFLNRKDEYLYNGSSLGDVRPILPVMKQVQLLVQMAVNEEIAKRKISHYNDRKLDGMSPLPWEPNAAFVNCYDGPQSSVGWHTDQLTYLGPHPVIGSLSLGVQREFRIRRIVPKTEEIKKDARMASVIADAAGQISIPLPHNSLLVMHGEMQEHWKHAVVPASSATGGITPHTLSQRKRINITYRWYRPEFGPDMTPSCKCKVKVVLKFIRGKYVWVCQTSGRVVKDQDGKEVAAGKGCDWFGVAEFDGDGVPVPGRNESA